MNKINTEDEKIIYDMANLVLKTTEIKEITRLGGLTNHTYRVKVATGDYTIRIPGEGTEDLINRKEEITSNKLACSLGIDASLLYMDEKGIKVMEYIENAITMSSKTLKEKENIRLVADIFRTLHQCKEDTGVKFEVFKVAKDYENFILSNHVDMFDNYELYKAKVELIQAHNANEEIEFAPCHNDPLCENWIKSGESLYLIDWEYAGMNDPLWDLADVSIEAEYNEQQDKSILDYYFDYNVQLEIAQRFLANKIYIDYLWSLWGKTRVPFDSSMIEYADLRFERMKENIKKWENLYV